LKSERAIAALGGIEEILKTYNNVGKAFDDVIIMNHNL